MELLKFGASEKHGVARASIVVRVHCVFATFCRYETAAVGHVIVHRSGLLLFFCFLSLLKVMFFFFMEQGASQAETTQESPINRRTFVAERLHQYHQYRPSCFSVVVFCAIFPLYSVPLPWIILMQVLNFCEASCAGPWPRPPILPYASLDCLRG